jgi:alkylation response protein AidB-like acyl-CoA dehydrogenase
MDFDLPAMDDSRRLVVREWLEANPDPSFKQLAEAGYVVPHWPPPYGHDADPEHQLLIDEEVSRAGVVRPGNQIGIGWAGPTILAAGTQEQKDRYLPKILSGEEIWCQMFSEPDAGSDLANLSTRAVRDGDTYLINGSKIWTSAGHHSDFGILIARTDPDAPKHKGISYFICPTDLPGLTMTPIIDMTTAHSFNQVFFDDVILPAENLVGAENDGWRLTKVTLSNERVSLSSGGSLWGAGPSTRHLLDLVRSSGGIDDPLLRQKAAALYAEAEVLRLGRLRVLSARIRGEAPGPEASVLKILADEHGQRVMGLAADLAGTHAMLTGSGPAGNLPPTASGGATENNLRNNQYPNVDPVWHYGYLFAPALTLGGGTFAVQRNIVAEHVLGLPREPNLQMGMTWAETQGASSR